MKNKFEFVELKECDNSGCCRKADVFCVSCEKWFCSKHIQDCVQCEQPVCKECYLNDLCCLVRPWGKKTEEHLTNFYENMIVDGRGMNIVPTYIDIDGSGEERQTKWNKIRKSAMKRSVEFCVDNFDAFWTDEVWYVWAFAICFPRISKYLANEETRRNFVDFMKKIAKSNRWLFSGIVVYSTDRNELVSMAEETIRNDAFVLKDLIKSSLRKDGKALFDCLKNRGLLDWSKVELIDGLFVGHIDGMKWIESNGIDVVNNKEYFKRFAQRASKQVKEYLATKGGKMIHYLSSQTRIHSDDLEIICKFKGVKAIESINVEDIRFGFKEVKYLKSIGYKFDKEKILSMTRNDDEYYALLCFNVLKYEDFEESAKSLLKDYVSKYEIKACKHMYPFMKEIRKKKIMTVLICMKKIPFSYPLPKEISWNILDYAYSSIKERGSL